MGAGGMFNNNLFDSRAEGDPSQMLIKQDETAGETKKVELGGFENRVDRRKSMTMSRTSM